MTAQTMILALFTALSFLVITASNSCRVGGSQRSRAALLDNLSVRRDYCLTKERNQSSQNSTASHGFSPAGRLVLQLGTTKRKMSRTNCRKEKAPHFVPLSSKLPHKLPTAWKHCHAATSIKHCVSQCYK